MRIRRTFVISGAGLTVHRRRGRKLPEPFSFESDDAGRAQFARHIEQYPNDVTCVIADVVEEEFREETVPHVPIWERRALMRARAGRAFRDARYVHSTRLAREPGGRRDDRVLFSAITRTEVLDPWLDTMVRHGVPLAGIYSPAMLTGAMLKAIGAESENVLVVSFQSGSGLRQTWFRRGRLRLSRLAVLPDPDDGRYGSHVLDEVDRTCRYLDSLRTAPDEPRLDVRVLSHGEPLDALRRELGSELGSEPGDDPDARCIPVDLAVVARRLGMRGWGGEAMSDRLFVHLLARHRPPSHYATARETRALAMLRTRSLLRTASAGLVAGGCVLGGVAALEGVAVHGHARSLAQQTAVYEDRYREAQAALPSAPAEPSELERVVAAVDTLRERRADPVELLALIGDALAGFPKVRIEGISWRLSDHAEAPAGAEIDARGEPRRAGEETRRHPAFLFQIAHVSARIEPFDGDYRAAIDTVRRLAEALAAPSGVEHVRVLSLPLDLSPEQTLTGDAETTADNAAFEIRVALRVPVPGGSDG